jgi:hypothetical protein
MFFKPIMGGDVGGLFSLITTAQRKCGFISLSVERNNKCMNGIKGSSGIQALIVAIDIIIVSQQ